MSRTIFSRRIVALAAIVVFAASTAACSGVISFDQRPATGYVFGSHAPLRVAILDETGGNDWSPAVQTSVQMYADATPMLAFQTAVADANIVVEVRRYDDEHPPEIKGYVFPIGAGGFATVYDDQGLACNFPPSTLPLNCDGEIATAIIYLNDIIPQGTDIEARRERLIIHELGHAMGLIRHAPTLDIPQLAARYGWPAGS